MKQVLGVDVQPTEVKMRVLDIPPIDMTDGRQTPAASAAASQTAGATTPRRKARKPPVSKRDRPARPKPASTDRPPSRTEKPPKRRDGSVGRETFQAVEALVKQGMSKTEAFKQVAADTGKKVGAVSANYYRVARASGAVKPRKRTARRAPVQAARRATAPRRERPAGSDGVDQIVRQLTASVAALTEAVNAQDAEIGELRGRLDGAHRLLTEAGSKTSVDD
jgi:hypothetical protein